MKTQIVLLSMALFVVNAPEVLPVIKLSADKPILINKIQNIDFAFFRTHRQGKGVTAVWGLTSNAGVCGFTLQRTYQDPNDPYSMWEDVNSFVGGSSRSFTYTDENVFPGYIYYRVTAWMYDGNSVTSEIAGVKIVSH